jgi:hypothetical protein
MCWPFGRALTRSTSRRYELNPLLPYPRVAPVFSLSHFIFFFLFGSKKKSKYRKVRGWTLFGYGGGGVSGWTACFFYRHLRVIYFLCTPFFSCERCERPSVVYLCEVFYVFMNSQIHNRYEFDGHLVHSNTHFKTFADFVFCSLPTQLVFLILFGCEKKYSIPPNVTTTK